MQTYFRALVLSVVMVSTGVYAQVDQQQPGAAPPPVNPSKNGLPPGFSGHPDAKSSINSEMQKTSSDLQKEVLRLQQEGKLAATDGNFGVGKLRPSEKAKERDFKELNKLSQTLTNELAEDTKRRKYTEPESAIKTPAPEAPEPITNLTPAMKKSANDDTAIIAELNDGQHVVFRNNGYVSIMTERGRAITPPDGILTLKDGTTFNIKDGMRTE